MISVELEATDKTLRELEEGLDKALEDYVLEACEILDTHITVRNPGTAKATPGTTKRRATSPHPGRLRGSWRWTLDTPSEEKPGIESFYPVSDALAVKRGLGGFKLGNRVIDANNQDYAPVIDAGRTENKNGVMSGSLQNPDGILDPAVEAARPEIEALEIVVKGARQ